MTLPLFTEAMFHLQYPLVVVSLY
uniref:Uncharacterized protein n=1 Tax=Rhizophora mucronata TaxID=61149 RepID=A0A2P2MVQ8_RHIMU